MTEKRKTHPSQPQTRAEIDARADKLARAIVQPLKPPDPSTRKTQKPGKR